MKTSFAIKPQPCPVCRHVFDAAENIDKSAGPPKRGDVTVCIKCGSFLVFGKKKRLAVASPEVLATLNTRQWLTLQAANGLIERMQLSKGAVK